MGEKKKKHALPLRWETTLCFALEVAAAVEIKLALSTVKWFSRSPHGETSPHASDCCGFRKGVRLQSDGQLRIMIPEMAADTRIVCCSGLAKRDEHDEPHGNLGDCFKRSGRSTVTPQSRNLEPRHRLAGVSVTGKPALAAPVKCRRSWSSSDSEAGHVQGDSRIARDSRS